MSATEAGFVRVEYDLEFFGGDYDKVGQFALVPFSVLTETTDVAAAFQKQTGIDPQHIIHFSLDEVYDTDGAILLDDTSGIALR